MIILRRTDMSDKDIARFWAKVDKSGDCWTWTGSKRRSGKGGNEYGVVGFAGKVVYAHRFSYALVYGECPANRVIDHKCRNPLCVNPDHLHAVTQSVNMQNLGKSYKNSKTGVRGVVWRKDKNKFEAKVESKGRNYFGGYYADIHDAEKAAIKLRCKLMENNLLDRDK